MKLYRMGGSFVEFRYCGYGKYGIEINAGHLLVGFRLHM